jgi:hypothetical protein
MNERIAQPVMGVTMISRSTFFTRNICLLARLLAQFGKQQDRKRMNYIELTIVFAAVLVHVEPLGGRRAGPTLI